MTGSPIPLASLRPEEAAIVHSVDAGHGLIGRLNSMGLYPGVAVKVIAAQPAHGPVVVEVARTGRLALGRGIARKVMVEVTES